MTKIYLIFICGFIALFVNSCDIINPDEEIPAYIEFEPFGFSTKGSEGSASHKITEGWIYVDGDLIGAFAPNKPFPVLHEGISEIVVDPGIHENGISSNTILFPLYTRFTTSTNLVKGEITKIKPEFEYRSNLVFVMDQNFSDPHIFKDDRDNNSNTGMVNTMVNSFEGPSGLIHLDDENPIAELATEFVYAELPDDNFNKIYLELNYKTDIGFNIGVIGIDNYGIEQAFYSHGLNTKQEWNKVYLNLKEVINSVNAPQYKISILAVLPEGMAEADILLDNIKLVHTN